jgi:hypothetical protein
MQWKHFVPAFDRWFNRRLCPAVISYRKHLWEAVQLAPSSWENILAGGRRIKPLPGARWV